jgi:hypothetical protein
VLDDGEATVLGRRHVLPLEGADNASWSGMMLGEKKVLVLVDPAQPRVLSFRLTDAGWINDDSYPIISDVQAIASVAAEPGTLLLWAKDAADLHVSRWDDGRLTYPRPMTAEAPEGDRVLALDRVGQTTWWVRKRGEDLHLYRWSPGMDGPSETRFAGAGGKADKAKWIGGERLLVMEKYARNPVLVQLREGKAITTTPGQLSKASLDDYVLLEVGEQGGSFRAARIADGVLQWVDDDLNPSDQVMLPDGLNLSAYVPIDEKQAWALQSGGERIHRMAADASGIMRVVDSIETAGGGRLLRDPVLGLLLIDGTQLTQLTEGTHRELRLIDTIDSRVGRPSGVREATIHRLWTIDITGDGDTELVQSDDNRHQLTALRRDDEKMTALMSWPVFEDSSYPYGGVGNDRRQNEPRAIAALDIDGDDRQDLALLVHDRLLFYLGREKADDSQLLTREGK